MPWKHGNTLLSEISLFYLYALLQKFRTPLAQSQLRHWNMLPTRQKIILTQFRVINVVSRYTANVGRRFTRLCAGDVSWLLQNEGNWGCENGGAGVSWWTVEHGWWFFASAYVEICWRWVHWQRKCGLLGKVLDGQRTSMEAEWSTSNS